MKFSEQWLREWVNPKSNTHELAEKLSMSGLEVDSIAPAITAFSGVLVGEIIAVEKHPDATRLNICRVNIGSAETLTIVCGGTNVRQGLKVPVATVGAKLPQGLEIKKAKLRGVESQGMICSEAELELSEANQTGHIMELPDDAPLGINFREYLQADDTIIEIDFTPNRGDCLSVKGLARDISALYALPLQNPVSQVTVPAKINNEIEIAVVAKAACPYYAARVIRGINPNVKSPKWLIERLRRSGLRSVLPIVDVVNYVMLELGQPMHAFDLAKLDGKNIDVRYARPQEKFLTLTDQSFVLNESNLVIADKQNVIALAGIIGGKNSAASPTTTDILLESAYFDPSIIAKSAQQLHSRTDSSQRFERGIDPEGVIVAMERATELLLSIAGGEASNVKEVRSFEHLPKPKTILLRSDRLLRILGTVIPTDEVKTILHHLGMTVVPKAADWEVTVPPFRHDMELEIDLIEEVARVYGYQNIPTQLPVAKQAIPSLPIAKINPEQIASVLISRGYHETITYSFVDKAWQQALLPSDAELIPLLNPISSDLAVMRVQLWPGLLHAIHSNLNRQQMRVRFFETGLCFERKDGKTLQSQKLGLALTGDTYLEQWGEAKRKVDFFDLKGDVEALLALTGHPDFRFVACEHPALHPGKSAHIVCEKQVVGVLGMLHPRLQHSFDLAQPVYLAEIDFSIFNNRLKVEYEPISKFPSIRRDIAIVVDQALPIANIVQKIRDTDKSILSKVQLFDIYQGEGVDSGRKSVALSLTFVDNKRTLTDEEINAVMMKVVNGLSSTFDATLRE